MPPFLCMEMSGQPTRFSNKYTTCRKRDLPRSRCDLPKWFIKIIGSTCLLVVHFAENGLPGSLCTSFLYYSPCSFCSTYLHCGPILFCLPCFKSRLLCLHLFALLTLLTSLATRRGSCYSYLLIGHHLDPSADRLYDTGNHVFIFP